DSHGMVMVMGVTGSGKSTFVNLLKPGAVRVEHGLHSAPEPPQAVKLVLDRRHRRSVTVVDTPGFDDTQRSGSTVLKEILRYLSVQYTLNIPLKGIIYLHQIHETRMRGSATQYLKTLQSLCSGPDALKNVIFVTTRWDMVKNQEDGMRREQELIDDWLSPMLEKGATVMRFHGSPAEAQAMVSRLVSSEESLVLDVQRELVDDEKSISETQ
ncbi:P-loop containing nucleoside triphosphate hydrolase protein, partial [Apiosordaria backusii]